jgi:hypothetical protein
MESVNLRTGRRRIGPARHPGSAVLAEPEVPSPFADGPDGDTQVTVPEQGSIRDLARGHGIRRGFPDAPMRRDRLPSGTRHPICEVARLRCHNCPEAGDAHPKAKAPDPPIAQSNHAEHRQRLSEPPT